MEIHYFTNKYLYFFPPSVPFNSVKKILEISCIRKSAKYIPQKSIWLNRLFIDLANLNEKVCLTINCSGINSNKPSKFRSNAEKPDFQTCYFNVGNDKQIYNTFISRRLKDNEFENSIHFKIEKVKSKTCSDIFDARFELGNLKNGSSNAENDESIRTRYFERTNSEQNEVFG